MKKRVCVLICTYNRQNCLEKTLNGLLNQTYKIDSILIVDNNSTDNTIKMLKERGISIDETKLNTLQLSIVDDFSYMIYLNSKNVGGAGGFKIAFQYAMKLDFDYFWVMDDDVLPQNDCLENLLLGMDNNYKITIPNRTCSNYKDVAILKLNWDKFFFPVEKKKTINNFNQAYYDVVDFPFEGPLFSSDIIKKVGLPDDSYFLLFDDSDYALRCQRYSKIRFVTNATLERQLTSNNNEIPLWKLYYLTRNSFLFDKRYGKNIIFKYLRPLFIFVRRYMNAVLKKNFFLARCYRYAYMDMLFNNLGKTVNPGYNFERRSKINEI